MGVAVSVDPRLSALLGALGLLDADGSLQPSWFSHPLEAIRHCLDNDSQRAALFQLLEQALPASGGPPGSSWHPLLTQNEYGNVYLTVDGDTIGVAAAVGTVWTDLPAVRATIRLPLITAGGGRTEATVGPLEVLVAVELDPNIGPASIGARVLVGIDGSVRVGVRLEDATTSPPSVVEFDPTTMDARTVNAIQLLLRSVLHAETGGEPHVRRLVDHLPGVLGLGDPLLSPLPLTEPDAIRTWFADIVSSSDALPAWFTHVAGALGALPIDDTDPEVQGVGTLDRPLRATLLSIQDVALELRMAAAGSPTEPALHLGVAVVATLDPLVIAAQATLAAIPLAGTGPVIALPAAAAQVSVAVSGGQVEAGVAWDGAHVVPLLRLREVMIANVSQTVDLTDATAVVAAVAATVLTDLGEAIGLGGNGAKVLTLVGLAAPTRDAASPHKLGADALSGNLLRAIAEVHRGILDDPDHSWKYVLADLAGLLGLEDAGDADGGVDGAGNRADPWRLRLAGDATFALELAAWDDRQADTAVGVHPLRLGLRATAGPGSWQVAWSTELLAFDLAPSTPTAIRLVGAQHLELSIAELPSLDDVAGFTVSADQLAANLSWLPGSTSRVAVNLTGLRVRSGEDSAGPLNLILPGTPDLAQPDLGLGLDPRELVSLVRLLLTRAWSLWGSDQTAHTVAGLVGLHDRLAGLPEDWPALLSPTTPDLAHLVSDPLGALADYGRTVLTRVGADGTPFAVTAITWLAALIADELPDDPAGRPPVAFPVAGAGSADQPWRLPIAAADAELLLWLDPGPGARSVAAIARATDGEGLLNAVAAAHDPAFDALLHGRDRVWTGLALDELRDWLADGDGLVPYDSQTAVPTPLWKVGTPLAAPHGEAMGDPSAIAQTRAQLIAWASPPALLLSAAPGSWSAMLGGVEPGHDPDARFDLRGRPTADLSSVTAIATAYPVDLDPANLDGLVAQIDRVAARVRTLTGASRVALVGHGPAGVAARVAAARTPAATAGVVTIAAPHTGSELAPLTRADLADATRLADALAATLPDATQPTPTASGTVAAVRRLRSMLDGGPPTDGVLPAGGTYAASTFAGLPALTPVDTVAGLAIGARLPGDLITDLAATYAARPRRAGALATHLGVGACLRLPTPVVADDGVDVDLRLRVDLARIRLGPGRQPPRSPNQVTVTAHIGRRSGWLIGDAGDRADATSRAQVRARWAEVSLTLGQDAAGALTATPVLRLHEAGPAGTSAVALDLPAILDALSARPATVALPAGLSGPGGNLVRQCLRALDLTDLAGEVIVANLRSLAAAPLAWLGPRLAALLDALGPAVGASGVDGGWRLALLAGQQQLSLAPNPWTLGLTTNPTATATVPGLLGGITVDGSLAFPTMRATATTALRIGQLQLAWAADGLSLSMLPWLAPIQLAPVPDPDAGAKVAAALPRGLLSAALGILAEPVLGRGRMLPLDQLLLAPAQFLRNALGDGQVLRAGPVNALLDAVASALGRQPTGGLELPGGLRLHAVEPFALRLHGTLDVDGAGLEFDLGLSLAADLTPSPSGTITMSVPLPGSWGGLGITAGVAASGVTLSIQPDQADAIELLPHFDGVRAVTAGAGAVLPHALQELVEQLSPPGAVLDAVLDLATALGIYGRDPQGFNRPDRAATLARMLQPEWWTGMATNAPTLVAHIADLFGPGKLPLPLGTIASSGGEVHWTVRLPAPLSGTITAGLGWSATNEPVLSLTAGALVLGPVVLDQATVGFNGQIMVDVRAHLAMDGLLAPLTPAVEIGVAGPRFTTRVLPLGVGTEADFALELAPSVAVTATPQAAVDMVVRWGLPLALNVLVAALADDGGGGTSPLELPFWTGGPTARTILDGAGLIPYPGPLVVVVHPLPDPMAIVLGAIQAAASGISLKITPELTLSLVHDPTTDRTGIRLVGQQDIETDDFAVSVRFGGATWLDDPDAGVTLWLVEPEPDPNATVPLRLAPVLSAIGFGVVLEGSPLVGGSLEIGSAGGLLFFEASFLDSNRDPTVRLEHLGAALAVERTFVNLSAEDGDSFIAKVLPSELKAPFDLAVIYRDGHLSFGGTSPLSTGHIEFVIPLDLDFTIITITELLLGMRIGTGTLSLEAALSGGADVGPLVAAVKRIGLIASFGAGGVGLRLRPPDSVGLSIDASTLKLGGFLLVDAEHGRYVGAIEISVLGKFELSAIGIITTKMPDGSAGFSLLFIISMTLPVPIALGYGFFFGGAGGLLGLNRGTDLDALRSGLRTGTAESILFPKDIVRRADAIVRDLEAVFPIAQGQFVVGPMVLITWMTPPLISIKLGVILELGTPIRVGILGLLQAALPDPSEAVLTIKVAFLGTVDFAAGLLSFDAAIYDSGIGVGDFKLALEGDIAVRVSWGAQPDFLTSVGGFHPAFHPGAHLHLPQMRRLSLSLLRDNPHLTLSTYIAITANSLQIGAKLDFSFAVSGFSIEGQFGFDVLLQISPFVFDAVIYARLSVICGGQVLLGLTLDFSLRGPTPWIARGVASFSILCFSVQVAFEKVFGPELAATIADVAVLPAVIAELTRPENWVAQLDPTTTSAVSLLPTPATPDTVVLDAGGVLSVSQRVVPLATDMTRFGANRPNDISRVEVIGLKLAGTTVPVQPTTEMFSPGAFQALSDEDKLRSPAFVPLPGGVRTTAGTAPHTDYALARPARYDLIVFDSGAEQPRTEAPAQSRDQFEAQARGGATGRSSASRRRRDQGEGGRVLGLAVPADRYAVTTTDDLRPLDADGIVASPIDTDAQGHPIFADGLLLNRADAQSRLGSLRRTGSGSRGDFQVVPESQVVAT